MSPYLPSSALSSSFTILTGWSLHISWFLQPQKTCTSVDTLWCHSPSPSEIIYIFFPLSCLQWPSNSHCCLSFSVIFVVSCFQWNRLHNYLLLSGISVFRWMPRIQFMQPQLCCRCYFCIHYWIALSGYYELFISQLGNMSRRNWAQWA